MPLSKPFLSILLMVFTCLLAGYTLKAQELDEANFIKYTRLQGLSNNYISGIVQDSTGYIWIATHKGLNRFDGNTFQSIFKSSLHSPLPDNLLIRLHAQTSGEILGASHAGAFSFNPVTRRYKKFIIPCDSIIYFWTNEVFDITRDTRGNYIESTKTGFYIFNTTGDLIKRYDYYSPSDAGKTELIFGGWVHSLSNGFTLQQNGLLGSLYDPRKNRIDTGFIAKNVITRKLITDHNGEMKMAWSGKNDELFILNMDRNSIDVTDIDSPQSRSSPLSDMMISDLGWESKLSFINDSLFALTCTNNGFYLFHYDKRDGRVFSDGRKYFEKNFCTGVFKDREGRIWIGTSDGLYKQNMNNSFFSFTDLSQQSPDLVDYGIRSVYVEGNSIYAGLLNEGGLLILNKKEGNITDHLKWTPGDSYSNTVTNIFPYQKDTLWIATRKGILWFNKNNHHYGHLKIPPELDWTLNSKTRCLFEDSRNNVWISFGKLNSLVRYDRATRRFSEITPATNPLLKITFIFSIAEDLQGNIWLAGDGLCRWNSKKQMIDTLIPYPRASKLLQNYMYILDRDSSNNLWISSYNNEILQYNCTTNRMYLRLKENNIVDGNTSTNSPIINNQIWMGTDNGISAFNIKDHSVKQFTYADGLPSVGITSVAKGSFYDKESNRFYIGSRHRLISFTPDILRTRKLAPLLFIEKITTRDSLIQPADKIVRLKYSQNNLTVYFNTINYTDPEENRFAWRSVNAGDTSWNELTDQKSITLTNLANGWNPVQIKLYSVNNHWPMQVRNLFIYIQPPFWKTSWFIAILSLLVAGLIYLIYKLRISSVRKNERAKAHVQQLLAEEYKNQFELEQISNYFSSSLAGKNDVDEVLWDVTKNLIGHMNYEECIIYMWNQEKTKMIQKAAYGPKGSPKAIFTQSFDVAPWQGIVGHVMMTRESQLVTDTRNDSRYRVDDMHRLCELCVPIIHNDELIGIIDSEHQTVNHFKERDVKILTTIATLVGNKIKQIESEQSLAKKQKEISFINQQLAEAQLSALQTQMNPHFIFNSLNSIKGLILSNEQQKASKYLSKFAQMIRMTLNQSKEIFTTLHENLEHLEYYLLMEKLRFDDSFSFKIEVDECIDREETVVPTLMIQPLTENAIWHGLLQKEGEKNLLIRFSRMADTISCAIVDNGIGINRSEQIKRSNKSSHQPVGLTNLRNRIKIMNEKYNIGCVLEIIDLNDLNREKSGTCAILRFNMIFNKLYL